MKRSYFIFLQILFAGYVSAQINPVVSFETKFYFKDTLGNKDSIILLLDTSTVNYVINPQLGEVHKSAPFDSILEVRAAHYLEFKDYFYADSTKYMKTKKIAMWHEKYVNLNCWAYESAVFLIKAKHPPITVYWDRKAFVNTCIESSFITPDLLWHFIDPVGWLEVLNKRSACLSESDSFVMELEVKPFLVSYEDAAYDIYPSLSNKNDTIYGLNLIFLPLKDHLFSPCSLVSRVLEAANAENGLLIAPNPVQEEAAVYFKEGFSPRQVQLFDLSGRATSGFSWRGSSSEGVDIFIGNLPAGLYLLQIRDEQGRVKTGKLIKQ